DMRRAGAARLTTYGRSDWAPPSLAAGSVAAPGAAADDQGTDAGRAGSPAAHGAE
ncbi:unnamed protein product, partial [Prorocentrum cordatum]